MFKGIRRMSGRSCGKAAVIGAGIVGLFTAFKLREAGFEVEIYEKSVPGSGASTKNANVIHLIQPPPGKLRRVLALRGARLHRVYSSILGYRILDVPLILAATGLQESLILKMLKPLVEKVYGVKAYIVSGDRARDLEPALSDNVVSAMVIEGYGIVDSKEVISRLVKSLLENSVHIINVEAKALKAGPNIITSEGEIKGYNIVINAAGEDASRLARTLGDIIPTIKVPGLMTLHSKPRLRSIVARPPAGIKLERKGGGVIPQLDGKTLLGPTFGLRGSRGVSELRRIFNKLLSEDVGEPLKVVEGVRVIAVRGRDFKIRRSYREPHIIHLVGIESPGFTAAPSIAELVLEMAGCKKEGFNPP